MNILFLMNEYRYICVNKKGFKNERMVYNIITPGCWGTLIFSYMRRLGPFIGVRNLRVLFLGQCLEFGYC